MYNEAAAEFGILSTGQLCTKLEVSRNVLTRLRGQYHNRIPKPLWVGNALGWPPEAIPAFREILNEEERLREVRR